MTTSRDRRVGILLPRDLPAGQVVEFARRAEHLGFDELWVVEDLGFRGGIAQAATVLAVTSHITVGIGILPAGARNVAFAAMEISTLAQLHPHRLTVGLGHGMPEWMREAGAWRSRPLSFLREYTEAFDKLLRGEPVAATAHLDANISPFAERPDVVPPIVLGVRGPKSLVAAGEIAAGVVLAEPASPEYIAASVELVQRRRTSSAPLVITYDLAAVAEDARAARDLVRPGLAVVGEADWQPHIAPLPFASELAALRRASADAAEFASRIPDEWIGSLALAGTPEEVRAGIAARHAAGATTVVLTPVGVDRMRALEDLAQVLG
ncbi:LLM class flavin-dependent oxidoreductase [Microbacterium sp.]|uniref:LLM class flavin-dependent oxidoreductase n=1 Tax=Microbacterium sp. TaxID=51671 RepID=UPI002E373DF0|nr:LLM class flavin-dependent oxidoreductase [Microbacterium sp.]HEX5728016.1 LLM class flavin-dependent oxidoreductase [Microbacterium sp.]